MPEQVARALERTRDAVALCRREAFCVPVDEARQRRLGEQFGLARARLGLLENARHILRELRVTAVQLCPGKDEIRVPFRVRANAC
jgi:hypothetical protein